MERDQLRIPAADGLSLGASWFGDGRPEVAVLIIPAVGVRRHLYDALGEFLAAHGIGTLTWDWRGTGGSRPPRLRGFRATLRDWAELDLAGAISWVRTQFPGVPLFGIGHSFGGQAVGLAPDAYRLDGLVTVAAQSGYWGHWPRPQRYGYAMLWYVWMPLLGRCMGYFPSQLLGTGEDLPRGVATEWARWCRNPRYMNDYAGHRAFSAPILALSFSDDPFAPRDAVEALHAEYGSPHLVHRHLSPRDVGADRVGHFGFFRQGRTATLWDDVVAWIQEHTAPEPRTWG